MRPTVGHDPGWFAQAKQTVLSVAAARETFSTDDVWRAGLPQPREPRALGVVMRQLAAEGRIETTGEYTKTERAKRHGAPVALWRKKSVC